VPPRSLGAYLTGVRRLASEFGVPVVAFGHAGDGHLHVNALVDTTQPGFEERLASLLAGVPTLVVPLGGTPSGEHGDGRMRTHAVHRLYGPTITQLFARVKRAFDPAGILNPGVIVPTNGEAPLSCLKIGPAAAEIPPAIAEGLHRMERTGGWGTSPLSLVEATE
jgi:FAD/FMN-containing dehydrogenase